MSKYFFLLFACLTFCISCRREADDLEKALRLAKKNRPELEKVLEHYSITPTDNLKLKAAVFLIGNMDGFFFYTSSELDIYYAALDSIFSLNERYEYITEEQQNLLNRLKKPNPSNFKTIRDIQYISAKFLIDNIDRAFEDWKLPHAKALDFNEFCEYLLPYKSGWVERPDFWRSTYKDTFLAYAKAGIDISCNPDSGLISSVPSIVLNGKNYISILENFDTIPSFTISCWVNPSEYRRNARLFDFGRDGSWYVCFIPYNYDGVAQFQLVTMPYIWDGIPHNNPLPLAQRSHIAITYSENIISFYINGILQKRTRTRLTSTDLTNNYIGRS